MSASPLPSPRPPSPGQAKFALPARTGKLAPGFLVLLGQQTARQAKAAPGATPIGVPPASLPDADHATAPTNRKQAATHAGVQAALPPPDAQVAAALAAAQPPPARPPPVTLPNAQAAHGQPVAGIATTAAPPADASTTGAQTATGPDQPAAPAPTAQRGDATRVVTTRDVGRQPTDAIAPPTAAALIHADPTTAGPPSLPLAVPAQHASAAAPTLAAPPPPSAGGQVGQAVAAVHLSPNGAGQVTIHLQPADLGAVEVRIERTHDGSATITVQVERADTLHTLQQDVAHLHQALDRAGVPTEQRQVTLHLAAPAPAATASADASDGGRRQPFQQSHQPQRQPAAADTADSTDDPAAPRWLAVGVDITA
jgi:flagellar hook-length control protein FliK